MFRLMALGSDHLRLPVFFYNTRGGYVSRRGGLLVLFFRSKEEFGLVGKGMWVYSFIHKPY